MIVSCKCLWLISACCCLVMVRGMDEPESATPSTTEVQKVATAIEEATLQYYTAKVLNDEIVKNEIMKKFNVVAQITILLGVVKLECNNASSAARAYTHAPAAIKKQTKPSYNLSEHVCGTSYQSYQDLNYEHEKAQTERFFQVFHFKP